MRFLHLIFTLSYCLLATYGVLLTSLYNANWVLNILGISTTDPAQPVRQLIAIILAVGLFTGGYILISYLFRRVLMCGMKVKLVAKELKYVAIYLITLAVLFPAITG